MVDVIPVDIVKPSIEVPSVKYSTISPVLNPWFLKFIVSKEVEIPEDGIGNFLYWKSSPGFSTLTDLKVFLDSVLNLWKPAAVVAVENPIVLIPVTPNNASSGLLKR